MEPSGELIAAFERHYGPKKTKLFLGIIATALLVIALSVIGNAAWTVGTAVYSWVSGRTIPPPMSQLLVNLIGGIVAGLGIFFFGGLLVRKFDRVATRTKEHTDRATAQTQRLTEEFVAAFDERMKELRAFQSEFQQGQEALRRHVAEFGHQTLKPIEELRGRVEELITRLAAVEERVGL